MAVIYAHTSTTLSTASGFNVCDPVNIGVSTAVARQQSLATARPIPLQFANVNNCRGAILALNTVSGATAGANKSVTLELQEAKTVGSFTDAGDWVNITGHGLANGDEVWFTTTGVLPTNLALLTKYYVVNKETDRFNVSTSLGGAVRTFTGTGSGTTTVWVTRATTTKTGSTIANGATDATANRVWIRKFYFASAYAVDTTASKWRFNVYNGSESGGVIWALVCSDTSGASPFYAAMTDITATAANTDCVIAGDGAVVTIDKTATFKGVLAAGNTTDSWCCVCMSSSDPTAENMHAFKWIDTPAASYELTIDGFTMIAAHSGFRIGTYIGFTGTLAVGATSGTLSAAWAGTTGTYTVHFSNADKDCKKSVTLTNGSTAISWTGGLLSTCTYANVGVNNAVQAKVKMLSATSGTGSNTGFHATIGANYDWGQGILIYGEVPAMPITTLASDANASQADIVTVDDTGWAAGDSVYIGKADSAPAITMETRTIQSIVGTAITLNGNLNTKRLAGGYVIRQNGYGVKIYTTVAVSHRSSLYAPNHFALRGCELVGVGFAATLASGGTLLGGMDVATKTSGHAFCDNFYFCADALPGFLFSAWYCPADSLVVKRVYNVQGGLVGNIANYNPPLGNTSGRRSSDGYVEMSDCITINRLTNGGVIGDFYSTTSPLVKYICKRNTYQNGTYEAAYNEVGLGSIYQNNIIYGWSISTALPNVGAVTVKQIINGVVSGIIIDRANIAYDFSPNLTLNTTNTGSSFGATTANTTDIVIEGGAYIGYQFISPVGNLTFNTASAGLIYTADGTKLSIVNYNTTTNDDRNLLTYGYINRTGAGLGDTTVRTTGGFPLRFEPISSVNPLYLNQTIPTGNIQNKDMMVGVWCYINNANFWSGTNRMPRLTINYDNGTTAYAEAAQLAGEWQFLFVPFKPTTTYGQIIAKLDCATDQTGANAYVYFTDWSVLYPAGVYLNLGKQDLWANALPVVPSIATIGTAQDVWNFDPSISGSNTIGSYISKMYKWIKCIFMEK